MPLSASELATQERLSVMRTLSPVQTSRLHWEKFKVSIHDRWAAMRLLALYLVHMFLVSPSYGATPFFHVVGPI
ncbi:hypothetical protein GGR54DRAFT_645554 [Hypoxylon sp. NC1633]|nr:hypothetical protein GGR54DRAFT_645554 [Hypoxylon sp. NC1633]